TGRGALGDGGGPHGAQHRARLHRRAHLDVDRLGQVGVDALHPTPVVHGDGDPHHVVGGHVGDGPLGAGGDGGAQLGVDVNSLVGAPVAHGLVIGEDLQAEAPIYAALHRPDVARGSGCLLVGAVLLGFPGVGGGGRRVLLGRGTG